MTDSNDMFSAASFSGVLKDYTPGSLSEIEIGAPASAIPVIAFYGFRGGAGRTTALAHVASLLAARQTRIVAVDLDLEAPGLEYVLDCPPIEGGQGALALLWAAATTNDFDEIRLAPHLTVSNVDVGAPIRVIPAGRLDETYLARLDALGVPLWHVSEEPNPLQILVDKIRSDLSPQVILIDCRTGLSNLSASVIFHVADIVVCFLPVTRQSTDGLDVFLRGIKVAKQRRQGTPDVILVPSMVPEGPEGRSRLEEWFVPLLQRRYSEIVLGCGAADEGDELNLAESVNIVTDGVEYRRGIALADFLRSDFIQRSAGAYQPLLQHIETFAESLGRTTSAPVDTRQILEELTATDLRNLAFAEENTEETVVQKFIPPSDFKALVDRSTWYVVGAKGAGKTWLWMYLVSDAGQSAFQDMKYIAAHGAQEPPLSSNALREIERMAQMRTRSSHGAFWLFYAVSRITQYYSNISESVAARLPTEDKRLFRQLVRLNELDLQDGLVKLLTHARAGTLAERMIRAVDSEILERHLPSVTLLYDGLDVGFGSDAKSIEMRSRFVNGLVGAVEPLRGSCKRIFCKVFLREDIYSELHIQNQSHLAAAKIELQWKPRDLWILALNLVSSSPTFLKAIRNIDPGSGPGAWPQDEQRLQLLLTPFWGEKMEAGNKVSTAVFLQRRTADGKDRLFPRTLVQLVAASISHQQALEMRSDRVLRSSAIQAGYKDASAQRVADLSKEYAGLRVYLEGLKGMTPTGTIAEIQGHISKSLNRSKTKGKKHGAPAGALHAGPGGWRKVIERLKEIGVIREYKRARGVGGEPKFEVALLYRPGLGVKSYGV